MMGDDEVRQIGGGRRLTYLLIGTPVVLLFLPMGVCGVLIEILVGSEWGARFIGVALLAVGFGGSWILWQFLTLKPLKMLASTERLQLWDGNDLLVDIQREDLGCLLRCDSLLCVFNRDDRMLGQWNSQWAFPLVHHQFHRAMKQLDYPVRLFSSVQIGKAGKSTIVETGRYGSLARDPELGPVGWSGRLGLDTPDLRGPGLTAGPVAEFFGLVATDESAPADADAGAPEIQP
jgi:hypothetical protein